MLPEHFKIHFINRLGVDMDLSSNSSNETIKVWVQRWKITSAGVVQYDTRDSLTYSAADIADGGSAEFAEIDNGGSELWHGAHCQVEVKTDDSGADGSVDVMWEWSTDGSDYPSDASNFAAERDLEPLKQVIIGGAHTRQRNFEL